MTLALPPERRPEDVTPESSSFALPAALRAAYYAAGHWRQETFWASFERVGAARPNAVALIDGERQVTFDELRRESVRFGRALLASGIGTHQVVALHGRHCLESSIVILGCAYAGVVVSLLPHMFSVEQIRAILTTTDARMIVSLGEPAETDRTLSAARECSDLLAIVTPATTLGEGTSAIDWPSFIARGDACEAPPRSLPADALALLLFSSGTTGEPKGVMHSANTVRFSIETYSRYQSIGPDDVSLVVTAFGFVGSSVLGTFLTYLAGCRTVLQRTWNADEALDLIARHRVTHFLLMPTHAVDLLKSSNLDATDCSSVARGVVAGLGEDQRLDARRRLCSRPYPMYGMSESPGHVTGSTNDDWDDLRTAEGRCLPGTELRICDDDDRDVRVGTQGHILVRGPNRLLGYYRNEAQNRASLTEDGFFRTGDVGFVDEKGLLTFVTRSKDIIRRGGVTITPAEIEAVLRAHPRVLDVAVIGLPDSRLGERACACMITRDGSGMELVEVTAFLEARNFPRYQWPESVVVCEHFPRTPSLKIQKPELRRQVLAKQQSNQ